MKTSVFDCHTLGSHIVTFSYLYWMAIANTWIVVCYRLNGNRNWQLIGDIYLAKADNKSITDLHGKVWHVCFELHNISKEPKGKDKANFVKNLMKYK